MICAAVFEKYLDAEVLLLPIDDRVTVEISLTSTILFLIVIFFFPSQYFLASSVLCFLYLQYETINVKLL